MASKQHITPEIHRFLSENGKKGGRITKKMFEDMKREKEQKKLAAQAKKTH